MGFFDDIGSAIANTAKDVGGTITGAASDAVNAVSNTAVDAGNAIADTAIDAGDAIADTANDAGDAIADTANDAGDAIGNTATDAADAVEDTAGDAGDAVQGAASDALNAVEGTANNAADTMADGVGDAVDAAAGAMSDWQNQAVTLVSEDVAQASVLVGDHVYTFASKVGEGAKDAALTAKDLAPEVLQAYKDAGLTAAEYCQKFQNGDLFFPGNPERVVRLEELAADVTNLVAANATAIDKIKELSKTMSDEIASVLEANGISAGPERKTIEFNAVAFEISQSMAVLFADLAVTSALGTGVFTFLATGGMVEAGFLVTALGLPSMLSVGASTGVGIIVAVAVIALTSAVGGAVKRDQLQAAIKDAAKVRFNLQQAHMRNDALHEKLKAIHKGLDALAKIPGFTQEMFTASMVKQAKQAAKAIEADTTDDKVQGVLADQDRERGSWTAEDKGAAMDEAGLALLVGKTQVDFAKQAGQDIGNTVADTAIDGFNTVKSAFGGLF